MKYIRKGSRPRALSDWERSNAGLPGVQYGSHGFPTADVRRALVNEQGSICAYTMIRIGIDSSHIEHLKPQTVSRSEGRLEETFDYRNMVACYPFSLKPGDAKVTFGAIHRGSTWDAKNFITPLNTSCELRMRYHADGHVRPRRSNDMAAGWTIRVLNLDDAKLVEIRRATIEAWGLSLTAGSPLSRAAAARVITIGDRRVRDGMFEPFCVAIKHAARDYVDLLDKAAARAKYARSKKRRKQRR
jgi:uncharacterized protein (TIGR02646 family)